MEFNDEMFNRNPFEPKRVTVDEIMMERIEEMKKQVMGDERFRFRIDQGTDPRRIVRLFAEAFESMGIEIIYHEDHDVPYLGTTTFGNHVPIDISVRRISDQNTRRIMEIEERDIRLRAQIEAEIREKVEKEIRAQIEKENQKKKSSMEAQVNRTRALMGIDSRSMEIIEQRRAKDNKKKGKKKKGKSSKMVVRYKSLISGSQKKSTGKVKLEQIRKLIRDKEGNLDWTEGKSFEEARGENKNTEYQEKIKWFCEKYQQDYETIYESFKDDDLDNLYWKGEKVEFPKDN